MANLFGTHFKVMTWGESHGKGIGCVIDGCPPGVPLSIEKIQHQLNRRKPGQSHLTTPRQESDRVQILSGMLDNKSMGTPLCASVENTDARPQDYKHVQNVFRPSHADFTTQKKYGWENLPSGGGRSSARETIGRVIAGSIAQQCLQSILPDINVTAFVRKVGKVEVPLDYCLKNNVTEYMVDAHIVRCPFSEYASQMEKNIEDAKNQGDSLGGEIFCVLTNVPPGIGEPVFDKLNAKLAHAMCSLPAVKGFSIGSGFDAAEMSGSHHNDAFVADAEGHISTSTNFSGGIQGGISNGMPIWMRIAFKPVSTIAKSQKTVTHDGKNTTLEATGRHDPCVVPRAVPMVESMAWLVLMDLFLQQVACEPWTKPTPVSK